MSLVKAVDELLAYVEAHHKTPDYGDRLESEFSPLDTAVYVEARRLGLQDADMPRKQSLGEEFVYYGRTNVPCMSAAH